MPRRHISGDDTTAVTYVELPDGEEVEVHWTFSSYDPGRTYGPVEACYPPEGGELLSCRIEGITDDGETWLLERLGRNAFDAAQERAFVESYDDLYFPDPGI